MAIKSTTISVRLVVRLTNITDTLVIGMGGLDDVLCIKKTFHISNTYI